MTKLWLLYCELGRVTNLCGGRGVVEGRWSRVIRIWGSLTLLAAEWYNAASDWGVVVASPQALRFMGSQFAHLAAAYDPMNSQVLALESQWNPEWEGENGVALNQPMPQERLAGTGSPG